MSKTSNHAKLEALKVYLIQVQKEKDLWQLNSLKTRLTSIESPFNFKPKRNEKETTE